MVLRTSILASSVLSLAACLLAPPLTAQQDTSPLPPDNLPTETLHVYTNRLQFPTLFMDGQERSAPGIALKDISITLDGGQPFHPSGMHVEGDDPLAIGVLLDLSSGDKEMLKELPGALSHLLPKSLHPQDHLYFYALDCRLIGLPSAVPADAAALHSSLANILAAPVHEKDKHSTCAGSLKLWDAIASVSQDLGVLHSRRVLLVVSPGIDRGSQISAAQVAETANTNSVAVFDIRNILAPYGEQTNFIPPEISAQLRIDALRPMFAFTREDAMLTLCMRSGGFILNVIPGTLSERLHNFVVLLRSRYVLEFARPDKNWAGWHSMTVSTGGVEYSLPTGASAPLADSTALHAPDTVPAKPSPAVIGDRHALEPREP